MTNQHTEILWADDSVSDRALIEQALKDRGIVHHINFVYDGVQALEFLNKEGAFIAVPNPDIIILDLNMPRKGGLEVLKEIKKNENFKVIPVIILSNSTSEDDIINSYVLNANSYITKPFEYEKFVEVIELIEKFWLQKVQLPPI